MFLRRAFSVCCCCLFAWQIALAQHAPPGDSDPARAANATPSAQITWDSVYVESPYVAMTFDDGPSAALTPRLLDLLAAHHMKATFFVVGQNAADHPEIPFGVHLTVKSEWVNYRWGSLTSREKVPSLIDKAGYFYKFEQMPIDYRALQVVWRGK
jgi:hypothetical protein